MAEFHFYLKDKQSSAPTIVYLFARYNKHTVKVSTGLKCSTRNWSDDKERYRRSEEDWEALNKRLDEIKIGAESVFNDLIAQSGNPNPEDVKTGIKNFLLTGSTTRKDEKKKGKDKKAPGLLEGYKEFLEESEGLRKINTRKSLTTTYNHLKVFQTKLRTTFTFEDIDERFYNRFVAYFTKEGQALNSVGTAVKNLKTYLKYAHKRGWIEKGNFSEFKVLEEETEAIYLNPHELQALADLKLESSPGLDRARDLFLVGAFTGLRFSDFSQIKPENIQGEILRMKTEKTGGLVSVPLHPVVKGILKKYKGELPPAITNQKMNEHLKTLGEKAKMNGKLMKSLTRGGKKESEVVQKFQMISTHTARRSFATNLYKEGFPTIQLMKITGHQTETAFLKYIRITRDEAAEQLLEFWKKKQEG